MVVQDQFEETLRNKKLVFLVGVPRSGTTWLQLLISRSPAVVTAQETDLFNIFLSPLVSAWNRHRKEGETTSLSEVIRDEDFGTLLRNISGMVLARIAEKNPSAVVVLEKTPQHVRCWKEILELWPEAYFIHIIRDPRSVVASLRSAVKAWGPQWGPSRVSEICEQWIADVKHGREIPLATERYQEVGYHELIADAPGVLVRLFARLGIPADFTECREYVEACSMEKLKAAQLPNAPFDLQRAGKYRFRSGATEGWRKELSKWDVAVIEHMAAPLMKELGYVPANEGGVLASLVRWQAKAQRAGMFARRQIRSVVKLARPGRSQPAY